jgi:hypothetical protein
MATLELVHQHTEIPVSRAISRRPLERDALEQRARRLAWGANAWHLAEFGVALAAGISAGSIALIGFGKRHGRVRTDAGRW